MSIVLADKSDRRRWNEIVDNDPQGNFFDRFEWCQVLGQISDHIKPIPMFIDENGNTVGVFPACVVENGFSTSMESIPFSDYGGGPSYRRKNVLKDPDSFDAFNNNLINIATKYGCVKISIRRAYYPDLIDENVINKKLVVDTNTCTFIIRLDQGMEKIYQKIKSSRRRSIRHGEKNGTKVREATSIKDLLSYYKIYVKNMNKLKSKSLPFITFNKIWDVFVPKKEAIIFLAEYKNDPIGGILLFNYKGVCHAWSGATLYEYQDKRPMDLLIWNSIKWAIDSDLELFDIGSTPNDPSSGHYFHKKTWGGEKKILYNYHIILQSQKWKLYNLCNKLLKNCKKIL